MIVLDCCAAVEMIRKTPQGLAFRSLMLKDEVVASELLKVEIRNTFLKYVKAGLYTPAQAEIVIEQALALVDEFIPLDENLAESFVEASRQNHSVYDLLYVTLARRNVATLFTVDKKLAALCDRMGVNCACEVEL